MLKGLTVRKGTEECEKGLTVRKGNSSEVLFSEKVLKMRSGPAEFVG